MKTNNANAKSALRGMKRIPKIDIRSLRDNQNIEMTIEGFDEVSFTDKNGETVWCLVVRTTEYTDYFIRLDTSDLNSSRNRNLLNLMTKLDIEDYDDLFEKGLQGTVISAITRENQASPVESFINLYF